MPSRKAAVLPKISIRLDEAEARRINKVCRAIKKKTPGQNPSKAAIVKRWIFMQLMEVEGDYGIAPPPKQKFDKVDISDLPPAHLKVLQAVRELLEETNGQIAPTFEEIGKRIGASQSWAQRVCGELKVRGLLDWDAHKHRDVRITGEAVGRLEEQ